MSVRRPDAGLRPALQVAAASDRHEAVVFLAGAGADLDAEARARGHGVIVGLLTRGVTHLCPAAACVVGDEVGSVHSFPLLIPCSLRALIARFRTRRGARSLRSRRGSSGWPGRLRKGRLLGNER